VSERPEKRARSPSPPKVDEEEKKRQRLAKLAAWKKNNDAGAKQEDTVKKEEPKSRPKGSPRDPTSVKAEEPDAWMPWEDPTAAFTGVPAPTPPPPRLTKMELPTIELGDGIDPLDAFMEAEIIPEVKAKEAQEVQRKEEERKLLAKQIAEGKIPKLDKILDDSDEEVLPDKEIQVPEHKVKLIVGAGGEKIKYIQKKSKCQVQVKKSEDELNVGFFEKKSYALPKPRQAGDAVRMVTVMLFGNSKEVEIATKMIEEAIDNREQKQKQREKEYERKRDAKHRDRQLYHMRHTNDYEALGIPIGASKADARKAYRELAKKWHPDKHPTNQEEAKLKFQAIQKAYDSLMTTDEDARIEALGQ